MAAIEEQKFKLKDGRELEIRSLIFSDGEEVIKVRKCLSLESVHTMHFPEMSLPSIAVSSEFQQDQFDHPVNVSYGGFLKKRLVGISNLKVPRHGHPWGGHVAEFGMGIVKEFWGQSIGKKFLEIQEAYALKSGIKRIQSTVRVNNDRGVALYTKAGFKIEGTSKAAAFINGKYYDEYTIAKILI